MPLRVLVPLLVVLALLLLAACAAPAASVAPSEPPQTPTPTPSPSPTPDPDAGLYVAVGDSVTVGIGAPRPQEDGFVPLVASAAEGVGQTRLLAIPGLTATGFRDGRLADLVATLEAAGERTRLVTVGLGANELLTARRSAACRAEPLGPVCADGLTAAVDEAARALDEIVATTVAALDRAGADRAVVAVLAYYNPEPGGARPPGELELAERSVVGLDGRTACSDAPDAGLNDRIACVAERHGATLVDLHAAFLGREGELTRIARGDVHPNADGYAAIAREILAALDRHGEPSAAAP